MGEVRHFQHVTRVDVSGLAAQLDRNPDLWNRRGERRAAGSPHADSSDIWVRYRDYAELKRPEDYAAPHSAVWYPEADALPAAVRISNLLTRHPDIRGTKLGGVLITRVMPGCGIGAHVDEGWHARYYEKFYVAVRNKVGAVFSWPSGDVHAVDGDVFWFRNDVPHWVRNNSEVERLSMIVCIRTNAFAGNYGDREEAA